MNRLKIPTMYLAAALGLFLGTKIGPATHVYADTIGYSRDFLQYQHDLTFFIQGMVVGACTLVASSILGVGLLMVVLTSIASFFVFYVFVVVDESVTFTIYSITAFGRALPGFFVGLYFLIGLQLSIAQYRQK
ncbi:membrane protein of unknown function [uncultured Woeseiaceae bacterium]|uniref:Uncharacterized protein n=1 Tax=uncultured Woeseiaceae bacterium TaxID=1983305 RepID=A0A7D9H6J8_9GAMM|nr:membrane protein of unknown function [uncultured Woeseiaceae bacterium]